MTSPGILVMSVSDFSQDVSAGRGVPFMEMLAIAPSLSSIFRGSYNAT
jgi:hypothetical protein